MNYVLVTHQNTCCCKAGPKFFLGMLKSSLAKHKATLTTKFLSYIVTPPQFVKHQDLFLLDELKTTDARLRSHKLYPAPAAEAGFTNLIYTKLSTFPSSKISQIMPVISTPLCHSAPIRLCSGQALISNPFLILTYPFSCYPVPLFSWSPDNLCNLNFDI